MTAVERLDLNDFTSITRHAVLLVLLQKQGEYKTSGFLIYNNRTLQLQPATASSYTKLQSIRQTPEEKKNSDPKLHITPQVHIIRILQLSIKQ